MMSWLCFIRFLIYILETKALNLSFSQNDFEMKYIRAEALSYNPEFISHRVIKNYKFNRTQAVSNMTLGFSKTWGQQVKTEIQAYRFMSNEYRHFPLRFSHNLCEALKDDDFGFRSALYKCGNLSLAGCPFRKGTYHVCKFFLTGDKFPPNIPEGDYMIDMKWFDGPVEIGLVQGYGSVKYKNFWQH